MRQIIKWNLMILSVFCFSLGYAWNIGFKSNALGPTIHTTYFITSNNASFPVHAQAFVGFFNNGICQCNTSYDLGVEHLKTGDLVDIDGFALKSVIGLGYDCMTIYYTSKQLASETFQLYSDGMNYINSYPATTEVMIL